MPLLHLFPNNLEILVLSSHRPFLEGDFCKRECSHVQLRARSVGMLGRILQYLFGGSTASSTCDSGTSNQNETALVQARTQPLATDTAIVIKPKALTPSPKEPKSAFKAHALSPKPKVPMQALSVESRSSKMPLTSSSKPSKSKSPIQPSISERRKSTVKSTSVTTVTVTHLKPPSPTKLKTPPPGTGSSSKNGTNASPDTTTAAISTKRNTTKTQNTTSRQKRKKQLHFKSPRQESGQSVDVLPAAEGPRRSGRVRKAPDFYQGAIRSTINPKKSDKEVNLPAPPGNDKLEKKTSGKGRKKKNADTSYKYNPIEESSTPSPKLARSPRRLPENHPDARYKGAPHGESSPEPGFSKKRKRTKNPATPKVPVLITVSDNLDKDEEQVPKKRRTTPNRKPGPKSMSAETGPRSVSTPSFIAVKGLV